MRLLVFCLPFLVSACALLPPSAPARSAASESDPVQGVFGFESSDLSGWSLKRLPDPDRAYVIDSPVRAGKCAASVALAPGVKYKNEDWKNELSDGFLAAFDQEIWYRVSHRLPDSFRPQKNNSCMLAQWHNNAELGFSPLLAHRYRNGVLRVTVAYGTAEVPKTDDDVVSKVFFKIRFPRNRWHDFVYRTVWSRGEVGLIQAWYNGKFMGTYRGPLGYKNDDTGPYFKTGVYCQQSPTHVLTAFVDEYRRGHTAADVLLPGETLEEAPAENANGSPSFPRSSAVSY